MNTINMYYNLVLVFLYSLLFTYTTAEYLQRKFKNKGFVVADMYKKDNPFVVNLGGTAALIGIMSSIVMAQIVVREFSTSNLLIFYFIVIIHATFGLVDDLINTSNKIKIIAPYFMALPVFLLVNNTKLAIGPYIFDLGLFFVYFIAPVYLMTVTNLINMHSGFNGLASGVSWILMFALAIRTIFVSDIKYLFYLLPIFGALTILRKWDKYPAKMIWGNVGSMMMGSAIGAYIIVTNAEWFGLIILTPHIFDFLLYFYSQIKGHKFSKIKFGKLREDGTIKVPTPLKLKFLLPYYFRLNEKQTVRYLQIITAVFCIIGLVSGL